MQPSSDVALQRRRPSDAARAHPMPDSLPEANVPGLLPDVDRDGLLEYSVVYTDRSINHMSQRFQHVMRDISAALKQVYHAKAVAIVPGSGTFGMEAVARQFATNRKCLVIRNGWFSFRWSQIFEMGGIPSEAIVLKARPVEPGRQAAYAPAPLDEVVAAIREHKPDLVFAPHVETASGMMLPDAYLRAVADAVHAVGGMFVLDCIASGTVWVDMEATGVDVLISAPQKGWSASPGCGLVMLGALARERIDATTSTSFACDLRKWLQIMEAYENGGFAYHATMPTDSLATLRDVIAETQAYGFDKVKAEQLELGARIRALLAQKGFAAWRPKASRRRAWSSAIPTTTGSVPARSLPTWACRSRPACRCNATSRPTSRPSASACSASTSCMTSMRRWRARRCAGAHRISATGGAAPDEGPPRPPLVRGRYRRVAIRLDHRQRGHVHDPPHGRARREDVHRRIDAEQERPDRDVAARFGLEQVVRDVAGVDVRAHEQVGRALERRHRQQPQAQRSSSAQSPCISPSTWMSGACARMISSALRIFAPDAALPDRSSNATAARPSAQVQPFHLARRRDRDSAICSASGSSLTCVSTSATVRWFSSRMFIAA
jgi:aspartate aminotransferase-like enzyme